MTLKSLIRFTCVTALCVSPSLAAATHYVNNGTRKNNCPGQNASIQQTVNTSAAGDTIIVCNGVYNEQVTISIPLTLEGQSGATIQPQTASVNASDGNPAVAILYVAGTIGVTVSGLIIDGSLASPNLGCGTDYIGIYFSGASGTIVHNAVRFIEEPPTLFGCQNTLAVYADNLNGGSNNPGSNTVAIQSNSVHDFGKNGITVSGRGLSATIAGNTVVGVGPTALTAQNGIQFGPYGTGAITGNNVSGVVYSICDSPTDGSCSQGSATGILLYDADAGAGNAPAVSVTKNIVGQSQGGIYTFYDGYMSQGSPSAAYSITSNQISDTLVFDGIGLQSNGDTVSGNTIVNSAESGIAFNSGNNSANSNTIIEAVSGILIAAAGNSVPTGNKDIDVVQPVQTAIAPPGRDVRRVQPVRR